MNLISHYTSADKAILEILPKKRLKFNELKNSNDPWEYKKNIYVQLTENMLDVRDAFIKRDKLNTYINNIRSISFTNDFRTEKRRCFCNPLMWAHYGDNHKGVCLVFDRNKLIELLKISRNGVYLKQPKRIKYSSKEFDNYTISKNENIQEFIRKNSKDLIFTKKKDWIYEKEFRLVFLPNKGKFINRSFFIKNISFALKAIILGENFPDSYKDVMSDVYNEYYKKAEFLKMIYVNPQRLKIEKVSDEGCVSFCCNKILTD